MYEVYRVIRYKNIENRKKFLKSELISFLLEVGVLILIGFINPIFGDSIFIILFIIYIIICRIYAKKLDDDKKVDFYFRVMILIWFIIILMLLS